LSYQQLEALNAIGIALSAEHNLDHLLKMIVTEARRFTSADGGTLYLVEGDLLRFAIVQNDSLQLDLDGEGLAAFAGRRYRCTSSKSAGNWRRCATA